MSGRRIGVFDSGIGGLSVLQALQAELPGHDFVYVADSGHAPYGERSDAFVLARARSVTAWLLAQQLDALVVACNTATAVAIAALRCDHPALTIVGVEPALKPAASLSLTGHVAVMATRSTLASDKFKALLASVQATVDVAVQACDGLAHAIERAVVTGRDDDTMALCTRYIDSLGGRSRFGPGAGQIDTLVLGCTHYPFARDLLQSLTGPDVRLIDTGPAVARQTRRLLQTTRPGPETTNRMPDNMAGGQVIACSPSAMGDGGHTRLVSTGLPGQLQAAARRWLGNPSATEELIYL